MMKALSIVFLLGALISACGEPSKDRIKRLVADKVKVERARLEAICRKDLISKAIDQVDSIIIEKALRDTSSIFIRPTRPDVPNLEIPDIDTLGIKPLFEKVEKQKLSLE